jgi:hypothetical protein
LKSSRRICGLFLGTKCSHLNEIHEILESRRIRQFEMPQIRNSLKWLMRPVVVSYLDVTITAQGAWFLLKQGFTIIMVTLLTSVVLVMIATVSVLVNLNSCNK